MMARLPLLWTDRSGAAAAEMALVAPLLIVLMFGSVETGNYFLTEHAVVKQVRDGARFASRLPLSANYTCPSTVLLPAPIKNVTKTGSVDGTASGRFSAAFWNNKCSATDADTVNVTLRCVPIASYSGVWSGLGSDIPIVKVSADVSYTPLFGLSVGALCMHASSEAPVSGL